MIQTADWFINDMADNAYQKPLCKGKRQIKHEKAVEQGVLGRKIGNCG